MNDLNNKLAVTSSEVPEAGTSRLWTRPRMAVAGVAALSLFGLVIFLTSGKRATPADKDNSTADSSTDKDSAPKTENGLDGGGDRTRRQIQAIQGKWYTHSNVTDGVMSEKVRGDNWVTEYYGQNFVVRHDGQFWTSGTWTLDASKDPIEFSMSIEAGSRAGKTLLGIMKWDGEDMIRCWGETRPERFESLPGQGYQLTRISRKPPQ